MEQNTLELRSSGTEGRALFGRAAMAQGQLYFADDIVFRVKTEQLPGNVKNRDEAIHRMHDLEEHVVRHAMEEANLTEEEMSQYRETKGVDDLDRFKIISYDMCPEYSQTPEGFGYARHGSYLNHSCQPNLIYVWDPRVQIMQLRTLTTIEPGAELSIDYLTESDWLTCEQRKARIKELWRMDCLCSLCSSTTAQSDDRAESIQRLQAKLIRYARGDSEPYDVSTDVSLLLKHLIEVLGGPVNGSDIPVFIHPRLADSYRLAAICLNQAGQASEAAQLSKLSESVAEQCFGRDNPNVELQKQRFWRRTGISPR